jgi:YD repeat-containing protein
MFPDSASVWRPDGSFEKWRLPMISEWNTAAQAVTHEISDGSPNDGVLWSTTYFDGLGRTLEIKREGNISQRIVEYDGTSPRVLKRTAPYFNQAAPVGTGFDFDAAGRLRVIKHPDLSTRRIQYEVGVTKTTDERGATINYSIDPFDRITIVRENQRDCFAENCPIVQSGVTVYRYDALDRLTRIIDAQKNQTEIEWTSLSQPRRVCDPDRGCTTYEWNVMVQLRQKTMPMDRPSTPTTRLGVKLSAFRSAR